MSTLFHTDSVWCMCPECGGEMDVRMSDLEKGEYVLATKWGDGDPQDAWCVGFYSHMLREDRYIVVDDKGTPFRANGYRRAKRISHKRGMWLLDNAKWIELSGKSLWQWLRTPYKTLSNNAH